MMFSTLKTTIATMTLICLCVIANAQPFETMFLGSTHAMLRVSATAKYLLLPVEESQENAHLRLIKGDRVVREFNCKLAVSKVDYVVPLPLDILGSSQGILDISFPDKNARTEMGNDIPINEYVCWKQVRYTDTFDTTNRERHRPRYHHTPLWGWMNDPNGMFYKDGTWHLYFQHNPFGSQWENMTWGHSISRDLVNWTFEGDPVLPDALGTIFSGSAVVDKDNTAGFGAGAIVAMYTSAARSQTQSLAYSVDNGKTFVKYAGNPVLVSNTPDFRDPHVFWNEEIGKWNMILAEGQHMKIYTSHNLKEWTFESDFGEGYGCHGGVWECPDLLNMGDRWLLICNINPGGPFGGSATQYFVGSFDGRKFVCEDTPGEIKWMDWGKDHYATVTFSNAPDGRHVAMPWMSNWQYAGQVPTRQYRSANGLPRDLSLFTYRGESYCSVKPSPEVLRAFRDKPSRKLADACRIDVKLRGNATITLSNAKGECVVMTYDVANETFSMDRSKSGDTAFSADFAVVTNAPTRGRMRQLQIFVDKSSIEVFDADGKMAMSNIVFPSSPYTSLVVKGGKARVYELR